MKKILLASLIHCLFVVCVFGQGFSNKGKDFWIPYPEHIDGTNSTMGLYITCDVNTSGVLSVGSNNIPFTVTANSVSPMFIGLTGTVVSTNANVYLGGLQDNVVSGKAIHVVATNAVVVFAHIIRSARSGATLALPTNVWGKEYIIPSYQNSGTSASFAQFDVIAEKANTVIEITPTINTRNGLHNAGVPFQITLPNVGDIYQLQFPQNLDPSGTTVKSIASGSGGCNKIAVYSSTTWSAIGCTGASGGDNFFQQLFPAASWGKQFLTGPLKKVATNTADNNVDVIRVFVKNAATIVNKTDNGVTTTLTGLTAGNFYEYTASRPTFIQADVEVQVIQYIRSQSCGNPATNSDPEMITLSAVEQTINDISVFSAYQSQVPPGQSQVTNHFINVIMKTANTGSFRINGAVPLAVFTPIPGTLYSYLKENVTAPPYANPVASQASVFRLKADSGFNAIAYGFGNVESYGYNAGTNVKDLYQVISTVNQYSIEDGASVCVGSPYNFKIQLPYRPLKLTWNLSGIPGLLPNNNTVVQNPNPACNTLSAGEESVYVCHDSTTIVNGKQVWFYSLPVPYTMTVQGSFPVNINALTSNTDGCGTTQDIDFDLSSATPPVANFTFTQPGCAADPVQFTDATVTTKPNYHWYWDFDDPASGAANFSSLQNPVHTFAAAGAHTVRFASITTPGCLSDTLPKAVTVPAQPTATISGNSTVCVNSPPSDISFTATGGTAPYTFEYNINGGTILSVTTTTGNSATVSAPSTSSGTFIYKLLAVKNAPAALCSTNLSAANLTAVVIVKPDVVISLSSAAATAAQTPCINTPIINIAYTIQNATGVNVSNLPAGIVSNYVAATGVLTISGTATAIAANPVYTINATGDCLPATVTGSIAVKPDGSISLTSPPGSANQVVCKNAGIIPVIYTLSPPSTGFSVTGLPAGVTGIQSGNSFTISGNPSVSGSNAFLFTVTATGGGCTEPFLSGSILVNALPSANFTNATPACETRTVLFNSSGSAANSGTVTNWLWNFGDAASGTLNTSTTPGPVHIFNAAGTYNVTLKLTTSNGCENVPVPVAITVQQRPLAGFIMPEVCLLDAYAQFVDTSKPATGIITGWQWDFGDPASNASNPNSSALQNPTHVYPTIGNYNIDLIVTTNTGCKDSLLDQLLVISAGNPVSDYLVSNAAALCASDSVGLQNKSTIISGNITKLVIYWDELNQPLLTDTIQVPVFNSVYKHKYPTQTTTQNYQVRMRAFSGNTLSCSSDKLMGITVHGTPAVSMSILPDVCLNNGPVQLTQGGEIIEGAPVTHSGVYSGAGVNASGLFNPTVAGSFNITYTYTTAFGCSGSTTSAIKVLPAPQAIFAVVGLRCEKSPVSFAQNSIATAGNITQWVWNFEGIDELHTDGNPVTHTFNNPGLQNVYLTVITNNGCKSSRTLLTIMINARPQPDFNFTANACLPNAKIDFTNLTTNTPDFIYRWTFANPPTSSLDSSSAVNPQHSYANLGPHTVMLIAESPLTGCVWAKIKTVNTIHPAPLASFNFSKPSICVNNSVSVIFNGNGADGSVTNYNWDFGDNSQATGASPAAHNFNTANTFNVKLNIVNSFGCADDTIRPFIVYPYPVVDAGADFFVLEGGSDSLRPVVSGNDLQYLWTASPSPAYLSNINIKNPVTSPVTDVTYTLKATARGGCSASDSVFVKVLKFPKIPNTFTPNNDGVHDLWEIAYLYTYPNNRVQVFTRTGQLVFESKGYLKPWNGTMNGKPLPLDTYYYIIEPGNGRKPLTGYVTILK